MRDALKTLLYPYEAGVLPPPAMDEHVLFLGAEAGFGSSQTLRGAVVTCVQGFRPQFLALQAAGHQVLPQSDGGNYGAALILCGRHRGQNEAWIADAVSRTKAGATIILAGSKEDGIASLRKRLEGAVELGGYLPKYHGTAVWFQKPADAGSLTAALTPAKRAAPVEGRFATAPGMFSHDRIDAGSRLLAEHLPTDLSGHVADFCAGWGYLAHEVARLCPRVKAIDLYEADFDSVEAAKGNLAGLELPTRFFWKDLLRETVADRYDAIVMNPPFHTERRAEASLGTDIIKAAAKAVKSGGRLVLVANRHLPYERSMDASFSSVRELARNGAFKVILAKR